MEDFFVTLSNLYGFQYNREIKLSKEVLEVRSIVLGMELDLSLYGLKVGKNEKYIESRQRLDKLNNFLDDCLKLDDYNYQLRYMYNEKVCEIEKLKDNIKSLEGQLKTKDAIIDEL